MSLHAETSLAERVGHLKFVEDEFRPDKRYDLPADEHPRVDVEDDREIKRGQTPLK